ncbi:MAG: hypothetical protein B6A08_13940 [Sorangiineae bacterium NIC37A_2]|jgi:hypothetical protein|nr:MAG: hypothetical protein B6A08_13940 [Sorangiineae bacterium NIC37A_2]
MTSLRLSRRTLLRGAGSIAIALPWLEAMGDVRTAHAQSMPARRFIAVYQPGGTVLDKWHPGGNGGALQLTPILSPLEEVKDELLVLSGLDMKCAQGEQHQAGIVGLLTGMAQGQSGRYVTGPSLDQVIASVASQGKNRKSIEIAVRWATGKSHGLLHPINSMTFADDGKASPIPPRIDPQSIFDTLFGSAGPDGDAAKQLARKKSILDFLDRRYVTLSQKLGAQDRSKLEEHLDRIRDMEKGLEDLEGGKACVAPMRVDTSDYNPTAGLGADDNGAIKDVSSDRAIPKVGKLMMDMLVTALACDMTAVGTLQWSDTEAKHTFPWLNLSEHHHYYQHDGGFRPAECQKIGTWYSEQHAYLLKSMAAIDMGGHSLLDESVVFFGSELADPPTHTKNNMPLMVAGGGGGLKGGRHLKFQGRSHSDLLLGLLKLFDPERTTFGDARFLTGELPGLRG